MALGDAGEIRRGILLDINATGADVLPAIELQIEQINAKVQGYIQQLQQLRGTENTLDEQVQLIRQMNAAMTEATNLVRPWIAVEKEAALAAKDAAQAEADLAEMRRALADQAAKQAADFHEERVRQFEAEQTADEAALQAALGAMEQRDQADRDATAQAIQNAEQKTSYVVSAEKKRIQAEDESNAKIEANYRDQKRILEEVAYREADMQAQFEMRRIKQAEATKFLAGEERRLNDALAEGLQYEHAAAAATKEQVAAAASKTKSAQQLTPELQKHSEYMQSQARLILFAGQGIQDLQYGFGAVVNNIPQIAQQIGEVAGASRETAVQWAGIAAIGGTIAGIVLDRLLPGAVDYYKEWVGINDEAELMNLTMKDQEEEVKKLTSAQAELNRQKKLQGEIDRMNAELSSRQSEQQSRVLTAFREEGMPKVLGGVTAVINANLTRFGIGDQEEEQSIAAEQKRLDDWEKEPIAPGSDPGGKAAAIFGARRTLGRRAAAYATRVRSEVQSSAKSIIERAQTSPTGLEDMMRLVQGATTGTFSPELLRNLQLTASGQKTGWEQAIERLQNLTDEELQGVDIEQRPEIMGLSKDDRFRMAPHIDAAKKKQEKARQKRNEDARKKDEQKSSRLTMGQIRRAEQQVSQSTDAIASRYAKEFKIEVMRALANVGTKATDRELEDVAYPILADAMTAMGEDAEVVPLAAQKAAEKLVGEFRAEFRDKDEFLTNLDEIEQREGSRKDRIQVRKIADKAQSFGAGKNLGDAMLRDFNANLNPYRRNPEIMKMFNVSSEMADDIIKEVMSRLPKGQVDEAKLNAAEAARAQKASMRAAAPFQNMAEQNDARMAAMQHMQMTNMQGITNIGPKQMLAVANKTASNMAKTHELQSAFNAAFFGVELQVEANTQEIARLKNQWNQKVGQRSSKLKHGSPRAGQ